MTITLVHAAATWTMVGLIWFVQVVHYPLFAAVGTAAFARYEAAHTRSISRLLALPAATEVVTAAWLFFAPPPGLSRWTALAAGTLLAAAWVITALVQVPLHGRLAAGFDDAAHRRLVRSNWTRTALWTARGGLALAMVAAVA